MSAPEDQAALELLWKRLYQTIRAMVQQDITARFGTLGAGGKVDPTSIGGGGGTIPPTALPAATASTLGAVKVGSGLAVTSGGVLSVPDRLTSGTGVPSGAPS